VEQGNRPALSGTGRHLRHEAHLMLNQLNIRGQFDKHPLEPMPKRKQDVIAAQAGAIAGSQVGHHIGADCHQRGRIWNRKIVVENQHLGPGAREFAPQARFEAGTFKECGAALLLGLRRSTETQGTR